jgi:uroporphyrin-III C-methyltransferase
LSGTVYLVGAGPGAADLLTLRAVRLLAAADAVFYDALVPDAILSLIAKGEKVPVGKRCGRHSAAQHFINKRLLDAARRQDVVVRLKGGDPMLFGRAQEEIEFLVRHGVQVEVVPGVTAALAASAELGVSLTRRGLSRSVAFVTPRTGEGERANDWLRAVLGCDTAVIYMGAGEAAEIARALLDAGEAASTPVAIVESASLPGTRRVAGTLAELPALAGRLSSGPAVILLGEVYADLAARERAPASERSASQAA